MYARTERAHGNRRDLQNLRSMLPFLLDFRGRVLFALTCLILAKVANVGVPVLLKSIVDGLDNKPEQVLVLPVALLLGYGALRLLSSLFNELRDAVFAKVRYRAMRRLSSKVLEHLHQMSLRFHLERKTGGISRDLERGTRSVSSIMNVLTFSIIPTAVEFTLIAVIMLGNYNVLFTVVTFATVALYVFFTFKVTEWRMDYRHEMNRLDSQANNRAIDSLINYETVKYFNNEAMEWQRYDETLSEWESNAVKSQTSMSLLNFGQQAIIALGVMLIMFLAAQGVVQGEMTIGDLVMVNAFMLQLFIPLGVLGMVYRQIKYTLADMDTIFRLLEKKPEIADKPDAVELDITRSDICFDRVDFAYQPERPILRGCHLSYRRGRRSPLSGIAVPESLRYRGCCTVFTISVVAVFVSVDRISVMSRRIACAGRWASCHRIPCCLMKVSAIICNTAIRQPVRPSWNVLQKWHISADLLIVCRMAGIPWWVSVV